jgi:hypothetical protein
MLNGSSRPFGSIGGGAMSAHDTSLANAARTGSNSSSGGAAGGIGGLAAAAEAAGDGSRVNGKEFFKDARNRLAYDSFHDFLQVFKCFLARMHSSFLHYQVIEFAIALLRRLKGLGSDAIKCLSAPRRAQ